MQYFEFMCMFYLYSFGFYVDFPFFSHLFQAWKYIHLPLSVTARKKVNNSELSDRCQPIFRTVLHLARNTPNRFEECNKNKG